MLVLVATPELQGTDPGDYSFTLDGELVTPIVAECSSPTRCGCGRGFPGFASSRATTTAVVVDRPHLTPGLLADAVWAWLERDGWRELLAAGPAHDGDETDGPADDVTDEMVDEMMREIVDEHVEAIADVCAHFPIGTVVERNGTFVSARAFPQAA
ncbi:MAG: hypothetical protein AAGD33_12685 [Actinomycetota bacterium]